MCAFGLKFPIDLPKIELLGAFTDRIGSGNKLTPKDICGCENTSFDAKIVKMGAMFAR